MNSKNILFIILFAFVGCDNKSGQQLSENFIYLSEVIPNIELDMRYYGIDNFVGKRVDGYEKPVCICTKDAALALKAVQEELSKDHLYLRVFDAYRPQRAVNHFIRWAKDINDTITKSKYYPNVEKKDLFRLQYIAEKSSHSRGSTFDVSIIDKTGTALDMGTPFDFFGQESWPLSNAVNKEQKANRMLLQQIMLKHGFDLYSEEWWHFTLKNEPFPEIYFNFVVK